jgi:diguanylate cyclase (GGDEF)-like protein
VADTSQYLDIISSSFHNFTRAKDNPQFNKIYIEALDEVLDGKIYGVFSFDSFDNSINPLPESNQTMESMKLAGAVSEIGTKLEKEFNKVIVNKRYTLIPHESSKQCIGFTLIKGNNLSEQEQNILKHLGRLWVYCKNQIELEQDNSRLASELGRNLHNFSVVRSIAQTVSTAQDLKHLLSLILKVAITTVNASRGFIMLENENNGELELKVVSGLADEAAEKKINAGLLKTAGIPPGEGILGRIMETQQAVIISDPLSEEEDIMGLVGQTPSLMCVPLIMNDQAFGVIFITSKESAEPFEQEDLDVLSILASHASAVLDQARLYTLATTDELTGLYTRMYYSQRIGDEFKRTLRYQRHLSLLVLDIDHFKKTNDRYGHLAGDHVLKHVARIMKGAIRSEVDTAVRFGGEEFVLILPETHLRGARIIGEKIRAAVENEKIEFEGQVIKTTISIGASSYPENGVSIEELVKFSDRALYSSKQNGRNRVTCIPNV